LPLNLDISRQEVKPEMTTISSRKLASNDLKEDIRLIIKRTLLKIGQIKKKILQSELSFRQFTTLSFVYHFKRPKLGLCHEAFYSRNLQMFVIS
jgi:hypothetical protein